MNALNSQGTVIGSGQAMAAVHTGQTTTVAITVVPLAGNGAVSLTVGWTASQVDNPSVQASLTPRPAGHSFELHGCRAARPPAPAARSRQDTTP